MAGDVSRPIQSDDSKSTVLITRDFLGGGGGFCLIDSSKEHHQLELELDLDLHVPSGWEKRLDLKSGKVYIERCATATPAPTSSSQTSPSGLQHLNYPPAPQPISSSATLLNLFHETMSTTTTLDLKHVSPSPCTATSYNSVCTLEKVKSALDRADREFSSSSNKKRSVSSVLSVSSPSNSSSLSVKEMDDDDVKFPSRLVIPSTSSLTATTLSDQGGSSMVAAACPACLLYVLISKQNPRCPKCSSMIQMPSNINMPAKKPRIDLNISI